MTQLVILSQRKARLPSESVAAGQETRCSLSVNSRRMTWYLVKSEHAAKLKAPLFKLKAPLFRVGFLLIVLELMLKMMWWFGVQSNSRLWICCSSITVHITQILKLKSGSTILKPPVDSIFNWWKISVDSTTTQLPLQIRRWEVQKGREEMAPSCSEKPQRKKKILLSC